MTVADQRPSPLPLEVLEALGQGHKVEAVKRLRAAEELDLREAKERVDAHLAADPGVRPATVERASGAGRWIALFVVVALAAVLAT